MQRATVYRHFPDEEAIYEACTSHYEALHPPPDPQRWAELAEPDQRLREALRRIYAYYAETEQMTESTSRDIERVPAVREAAARMDSYLAEVRAGLMRGRGERGGAGQRVAAAVGHALAFPTWRSLVREQGLGEPEAAELMVSLARSAAGGTSA